MRGPVGHCVRPKSSTLAARFRKASRVTECVETSGISVVADERANNGGRTS